MASETLIYRFFFTEDAGEECIALNYDSETVAIESDQDEPLPAWARLEHQKCEHCPLSSQEHQYCPLAAGWSQVIDKFSNLVSHKELDLEVVTKERTVRQRTTAQRAISSILGFIGAASGCPKTAFLKPMAYFHLPLSSADETIMRATGTYLLGQYIRRAKGLEGKLELEGLKNIYTDIRLINRKMIDRIKSHCQNDATINAIVSLDMFANLMPFVIDDQIEDIEHLFDAYFKD